MNIPSEFQDLLLSAGYDHPNRILWFQPDHKCSACAATIPIWADICYFCNGDDPTCPHDSEPTERFTWTAQNGKSYTVCLGCFDYIYEGEPG